MTKIGARLTGLEPTHSWTEVERDQLEKRHADLVDDHMRSLAAELNVDPLKLLTHFLVYEKEV